MTQRTVHADVVVVGAGTAGANAAGQLARRGHRVVLLERRAATAGGAQWVNGLLERQFVAAGVAPPAGEECVDESGGRVHLRTADGRHGITVEDSPITGVDMARLGARLRADARADGVEIVEGIRTLRLVEAAGRAVAVEATTPTGSTTRYDAALFVDASGRRGALRSQSSALAGWARPGRAEDRCTASDVVHSITDPSAAEAQLDRWGARPGEPVNLLGFAGGWSTRTIIVRPGCREVRVLVGCIADGRFSTAPRMLAEVRADHPWIGAPVHGGAGVIPLARAQARLTAPGLALVGDAASMVFPAHGSGVGLGLLAGSLLARVLDGAEDPGDPALLWTYQHRFHREHGGDLAFYDGFRRLSVALGADGVTTLLRSGLTTPVLLRAGLDQRRAVPHASDLPGLVAGLVRAGRVTARAAPALARAQVAAVLAGRPPEGCDLDALRSWDRRVDRLLAR